jgi:hypothetical protein
MNLKEDVKLTGKLTIKKFNSKKELVQEIEVPNLIVTTGKQYIANRLTSSSPVILSHMAIGNQSDAPNLTQTELVGELGRTELTSTTLTGTNIIYVGVFEPGVGTGQIVEAGIFNDSVTGTMLCRTTFPVVAKSITDTIAISWTVSVG